MLINSPAVPALPARPADSLIAFLRSRAGVTGGRLALDPWVSLSTCLEAIIGQEGFLALYDRSLHLAGTVHPWLLKPVSDPDTPLQGKHMRLEHLQSALQSRSQTDALQAEVFLFSTFIRVLSTLIGQQLTLNILRAAWGDAFEEAAQEISTWLKK